MKLIFNKPYKSIRQLGVLDLPDFIVLTGVNGAGKSHLLEAIENGSVTIEGVPPNQPQGEKPIRRFDGASLVTQDTGVFSGYQIANEQASHWENVRQHWKPREEAFYETLRSIGIPGVDKMEPREIVQLTTENLVAIGMQLDSAQSAIAHIKANSDSIESSVVSQFLQQDPTNRRYLVERLNAAKKLPMFAMSQDDFYETYPDNWQQIDLFQQSFARLFTNYQKNWRENELRARGKSLGEKVIALTPEEFLTKYGQPPWLYLNEVLEIANLDFRINEPSRWEDRPYEPILTDQKRGIHVKFTDLSSGERVIMSFALCLYHVNDPRSAINYPKVLLFDEIDAPLHPSMINSLLRTIAQSLVRDRNIKVILTTHSPSTVALSSESSIFVMRKDGADRLQHCSKDAALGILTSGVPTLSVRYENRRQVFVESKYDVEFYEALYVLSRATLLADISLSFIASGVGGSGNCDQVISVVNNLRAAGSRSVYGLIDWDLKNKATDGIFILGGGSDRYAIDNYLLDPMLVGLLLVREKLIGITLLGLPEGTTYLSIAHDDSDALRTISDRVILALGRELNSDEKLDTNLVPCLYNAGLSNSMPAWVLKLQGHRYEDVLKQAYPALNRYRGQGDLKQAVLSLILDERPQLIPSNLVETLRSIQSAT